jgi:galactokinase
MSLTVRYPGRACLIGEHCDWAGGASLAIPLPLSVQVTVEEAERDLRVRTALDGELQEGRWPIRGRIDRAGGALRFVPAAAALLHQRGLVLPPALLWVYSTLPPGRGFSSSAAFSLAVLDALSRHAGCVLDAEELAELAFRLEHDLLGVECGRLDPLACVAGSPVFLQWREGTAPLRRVRPAHDFHFVLAAFKAPRNTGAILSALHRHHEDDLRAPLHPEAVRAVREGLALFASLAEAAAGALEQGEPERLGVAMNTAQEAYEDMAAVVPELRAPELIRTCRALRESGSLGAKFSGAGGDGSVIALFPDEESARAAIHHLGLAGLSAWSALTGPS